MYLHNQIYFTHTNTFVLLNSNGTRKLEIGELKQHYGKCHNKEAENEAWNPNFPNWVITAKRKGVRLYANRSGSFLWV